MYSLNINHVTMQRELEHYKFNQSASRPVTQRLLWRWFHHLKKHHMSNSFLSSTMSSGSKPVTNQGPTCTTKYNCILQSNEKEVFIKNFLFNEDLPYWNFPIVIFGIICSDIPCSISISTLGSDYQSLQSGDAQTIQMFIRDSQNQLT